MSISQNMGKPQLNLKKDGRLIHISMYMMEAIDRQTISPMLLTLRDLSVLNTVYLDITY